MQGPSSIYFQISEHCLYICFYSVFLKPISHETASPRCPVLLFAFSLIVGPQLWGGGQGPICFPELAFGCFSFPSVCGYH